MGFILFQVFADLYNVCKNLYIPPVLCADCLQSILPTAVRVKIFMRFGRLFHPKKAESLSEKYFFKKTVDKRIVFCYNSYVHAGRGVRAV